MKIFSRETKLVTFLHLPHSVHIVDDLLTRLSIRLSDQVWCDSVATATSRIPVVSQSRSRVISFVTHRLTPTRGRSNSPNFIFWGRLHPQKGLITALMLFREIRTYMSSARFHIIGPDGGELNRLHEHIKEYGLQRSVSILGPMEREKIFEYARCASFYLQLSVVEGMAMSVIEAMQLGLVPVVTPVGEISNYCKNGINAVIVNNSYESLDAIKTLLSDQGAYQLISSAAVTTWSNQPLYKDSFMSSCEQV